MTTTINSNPLIEKVQEMGIDGEPIKLVGYPIVSERNNSVRLYQDLSLSAYFEFNQDDVVHAENSESDNEPTVVMVNPQSQIQAVFNQTLKAEAIRASWRPDPHPYMPDSEHLPLLSPLSGEESNAFIGTAVQMSPKMCRIVPIYKWQLVIKNTPFGPQIYPQQTFVGLGMDCTY